MYSNTELRYKALQRNPSWTFAEHGACHALALLPLTSSKPTVAEEAGVAAIPPVTVGAEAAGLLPLPLLLLLLLLLLTIALRQPPVEDECELQNESYVSIVALCVPVPIVEVTGPGAVGMSNVFDERNDASECGCVDGDGGGFCGDPGVVAGAGERIRLDDGERASAGTGERAGAGAGGDASAGMEADVGASAGAGIGEGEGEEGCVWTSDGKVVWGLGGKVSSEADISDGCTAAGNGGDVN